MMLRRGISPIEVIILVLMLAAVLWVFSQDEKEQRTIETVKIEGRTVRRACIGGFEYIVTPSGAMRQIVNEAGGGIRC